jgi:hypothetical protein
VAWFESHEGSLDPTTRPLWDRARHRCRLNRPSLTRGSSADARQGELALAWS